MVLAVVVLLGVVAVLVVVLLQQPRAPFVAVRAASLYALVYGQTGALDDVQVMVRVEAHNGNAHSATYFSRLECRLAFVGATLAVLRAYLFRVPARGVLPLACWYIHTKNCFTITPLLAKKLSSKGSSSFPNVEKTTEVHICKRNMNC
ncbi:hypothetical protein ZEAMMB73_Zm00001d050257 [Zea mays]|uniref:Uncharacterized protein n=1 Tax=Zea mays TaxID=4577 RepID=A0A1D6Q0P3_MAIZE|nr:hypothetical protein ZEAMMB73_Zm00001d050257 [Zea mays]